MKSLKWRIAFHKKNAPQFQPCHYNRANNNEDSGSKRKVQAVKSCLVGDNKRQGGMLAWAKVDNTEYSLCKSYPPTFYVPRRSATVALLDSVRGFRVILFCSNVKDGLARQWLLLRYHGNDSWVLTKYVSQFQFYPRSKGRMPALSWQNPNTGAILMRSAQPRTGILKKNCTEDEELLAHVQELSAQRRGGDGGGSIPLVIFDARYKH
eukprot:sb/3470353/